MKSVLILICKWGAMVNGQEVDREIAECLVRQYRHPAVGWKEDKTASAELYHFYKMN